MTYSHKSSTKMISPTCSGSATATTKTKLKASAAVAVKLHSNSIASSTNLSASPTGSMSSGSSTSSSCSSISCLSNSSSFGSIIGSGSGGDSGFFASRKTQNHSARTHGGWQRRPSGKSNRCADGGNKIMPLQRRGSNFFNNENQNQIQNISDHSSQKQQRGGGVRGSSGGRSPNSPNSFAPILSIGSGSGRKCNRNGKNTKNVIRQSATSGEEVKGIAAVFVNCGHQSSNNSNQHQQQQQGVSPTTLIPTNLTHFAGSKCFDAPSPTALPKPPRHWTMGGSSIDGGISGTKIKEAAAAGSGLLAVTSGGCASRSVAGMKSWKLNLLDDFDTHNLKLLLNVQS